MIKDYTKQGKCSQCGMCCSNFLTLYPHEITKLRELASKPDTEGSIKHIGGRFWFTCPFLMIKDENSTYCGIYEDRPHVCRVFKCNRPRCHELVNEMHKDGGILVDIMKDIVGYDYQEDVGMTYEEARKWHLNNCIENRSDE